MKIKKLKIFGLLIMLAAFIFALPNAAIAQQQQQQNTITAEKRKLIAELLTLTKADKQIQEITDIMLKSMETTYPLGFNQAVDKRTDLSAAQKERLKATASEGFLAFSKRFRERLPQAVNYDKYIENAAYPLYDKFFTEQELRDLTAFYKTPTGRKVIETMPQLFQESTQLAQAILLPDILKLLDEIMREDLKRLSKAPVK